MQVIGSFGVCLLAFFAKNKEPSNYLAALLLYKTSK